MFCQIYEPGRTAVYHCGFIGARYDGETLTNALSVIFTSDESTFKTEAYAGFKIALNERERESKSPTFFYST